MATLKEANAEAEVKRDWSDLPIDIIGMIIRKLLWADRIRFRAVCKPWQVPLGRIPTFEEYPWLLNVYDEKNKRVLKLVDPYRKKNYIVKEIRGKEANLLRGFIWASRYGWILCNKGKLLSDNGYILSALLFCPFTKEIIEFPPELKLKIEMTGAFPANPLTSFFINPASPECAVYAIWRRTDWVWMALCSPDDSEWKTFKFPLPGFDNFLPYGVTYLAGSFYTITTNLEVGVFNVTNQEWKILKPGGQMPRFYSNISYYGTMIHSDVDLLWFECKSKDGTGSYSCTKVANVWRYDFAKNSWTKKKKKMGNRTVFSSQNTSFSVGAAGKGRDLVGMIFAEDEFVIVNGENKVPGEGCWSYADFYEWMAKERKSSKYNFSMWIDPRPVWKKSDLVKCREVPTSSNI